MYRPEIVEIAEKFVCEVNSFESNVDEPKTLNVIVGEDNYFDPIQEVDETVQNRIPIYGAFKSIAFFLDNRADFIGSDTKVWNILLGFTSRETKIFMRRIKGVPPYNDCERVNAKKIPSYLYYKYGLVMINRAGKHDKFSIFSKYSVSNVLFVGKSPYKRLTKYFPNAKIGLLPHPSNKCHSPKQKVYESLDSSLVDPVSYYSKKFERPLLESFKIL